MSVDTAINLVEILRQTRLLAPNQLDEVTKTLLPRFADPRALARELLARDWLTAYQVNQLLQGSVKDLVLGQYNILQKLNDTYLGQVYKARHQHMLRVVALTIVRESLLAQPGAVERFYQEIQAASRLNHPHIQCAFDAGPIGRTHFFAMEYVDGIDLDRMVQQSGPLPPLIAAALIRQSALGLHHAYERRLLHHDLKPANLWLASHPERGGKGDDDSAVRGQGTRLLKICNLGLTLLRPRGRTGDSESPADAVDFVAPEQAAGTPLTDVRSNLYSLGCIYYYLLTGRPPFPDGDSATKLRQRQVAEPQPVEAFRNDVPGTALDVLGRLLAKRPEGRYATPGEVAQALGSLPGIAQCLTESEIATLPGFSDKTLRGAPKTAPARRRPGWPKWLPWCAALLALLGMGFFAALYFTKPEPPPEPTASTGGDHSLVGSRQYQKGPTREATILATLKANGYPTLQGKWYYIGPFDNAEGKGFDAVYPPELGVDLAKTYPGKGGAPVGWKEAKDFSPGVVFDLKRLINQDHAAIYLHHEIESTRAERLPLSLGSDDTLTVWANGQKILAENVYRGCVPDDTRAIFPLRTGKNQLLLKICNGNGGWAVYVNPLWPESLDAAFARSLERDFPSFRRR